MRADRTPIILEITSGSGPFMMRLQRIVLWGAVLGIMVAFMFPPIVEIDASVTAYPCYYFLLAMPELRSATFLWPITVFLLLLEWALILTLAGVAYWVTGRLIHNTAAGSRYDRDYPGDETLSQRR
jgi:hypothetical protein